MKKYYIDLDGTLCNTTASNYPESTPIQERIDFVNQLKSEGNCITIWTARGATSGIDWEELTRQQLSDWNIRHDVLLMKKPNYDVYLDDKSYNISAVFPVPGPEVPVIRDPIEKTAIRNRRKGLGAGNYICK